jgi:hypothetical protein
MLKNLSENVLNLFILIQELLFINDINLNFPAWIRCSILTSSYV